jgi:hypothetical protein
MDQSVISGPFNWSHKARAKGHLTDGPMGWRIDVEHDGYLKRLGGLHRRTLSGGPDGLLVSDFWTGAPDTEACVTFQLAPGLKATIVDRGFRISDGEKMLAVMDFSEGGELSATAGGEPGEGGWVSLRFGEKQPALRLVWRGCLPPQGLETRIRWGAVIHD